MPAENVDNKTDEDQSGIDPKSSNGGSHSMMIRQEVSQTNDPIHTNDIVKLERKKDLLDPYDLAYLQSEINDKSLN